MGYGSTMPARDRRLMHIGAVIAQSARPQRASPAAAGATTCTSASVVQVEQSVKDSTISAEVDGFPFVTYCYGSELSRPFLFPVHGPRGGPVLTRPHQPDDGEHPHQKGVWCAVDEVNGIRFWGERQVPENVKHWPQGKIECRSITCSGSGTAAATLQIKNEWLGADGSVLLEHTVLTVHANHFLEYSVTLTAPGSHDVTFGDTKEGFFGIR